MNFAFALAGGCVFFYLAGAIFDIQRSQVLLNRYRFFSAGFRSRITVWRAPGAGAGGFSLGVFLVYCVLPHFGLIHILGGAVGLIIPWLFQIEGKTRRSFERLKLFPDFLDLFALALSSGLTLAVAWKKALEYLPNSALKKELATGFQMFELGRPFEEVISGLKENWRDKRLDYPLTMIEQGLSKGFPLQEMIFDQAESLRKELLFELERKAETAKVKLLFPIVFFIFPAMFIILFGSLYLQFR